MSEPDPIRDEFDDLIDAYADGQLDTDQARRLLELIESSPEARARLAAAVTVERTLRALAQGPVATDRIMAAVAARRSTTPRANLPPTARGRSRRPLVAVITVAALVVIGAVFFRGKDQSPRPVQTVRATTQADQPAAASPEVPPAPVRPEPPALEQLVSPVEAEPPPPADVEYRPVYPWEVPAPPADLGPAPAGDGAQENGFVGPPTAGGPVVTAVSPSTVPLLWTRVLLDGPDRGSATPGDVETLLAAMRERFGARYRGTACSLDALDDDPAQHPLLLVSTHHRFAFTDAQRARLRRFVLRGGTIVFDAGLGSAPAYDAARREARRIFADLPLNRLATDHPLFHAGYEMTRASGVPDAEPWLEAVSVDCRAALIISRWGLAAGWIGRSAGVATAYGAEDALRLGMNLSSYVASTRAWARRAGGLTAFPVDDAPAAGRLSVAQIVHNGEWRTRPAALALLLHAYNRQTDVPVKLRVRDLKLDDAEVAEAPLLYLTGHEALTLSEAEVTALRRHLENGGFLLAEACCGRRAFDASFRAVMARVLPGRALTQVRADDELFRTPHRIERLAVTSSLAARRGTVLVAPQLEGIRVGEHYAVLYSPLGLAGAWESSPLPYADSYDDPGALKLGQNILQYAITH